MRLGSQRRPLLLLLGGVSNKITGTRLASERTRACRAGPLAPLPFSDGPGRGNSEPGLLGQDSLQRRAGNRERTGLQGGSALPSAERPLQCARPRRAGRPAALCWARDASWAGTRAAKPRAGPCARGPAEGLAVPGASLAIGLPLSLQAWSPRDARTRRWAGGGEPDPSHAVLQTTLAGRGVWPRPRVCPSSGRRAMHGPPHPHPHQHV